MPSTPDIEATQALGLLWGKSDAAGSMHLLLAHLLDTAAVAELIWDDYLAQSVRSRVDKVCAGNGRLFFSLVCGLHDIGKCTPAFQSKDALLADAVRTGGLPFGPVTVLQSRAWHHTLAGACILRRQLVDVGWKAERIRWVTPLVAGHHGRVPSEGDWRSPGRHARVHGDATWIAVQDLLLARVLDELGVDLAAAEPGARPSRATQLILSGAVIMADWIASDERHFVGLPTMDLLSMRNARDRARSAWQTLGLHGGWRADQLEDDRLVERRFGRSARQVQEIALDIAESMPSPGLLVIEAPMGEGKTEAALVAAEVLARRFGADGIYVGMPTQATSDPMFGRVRKWLATFAPDVQTALLHGKRRFNREWRELQEDVRPRGVHDDVDIDDLGPIGGEAYGATTPVAVRRPDSPAEWFLGAKRGLLVPVAVGTIDQLLHAATRTRHVMLRHLGLAGRIVVLDEVHAYDVYMSQFLHEALRWLADAGVCVVVLSATLPPAIRAGLVEAYVQGVTQQRDVDPVPVSTAAGYPLVTAVSIVDGRPSCESRSAQPWRESLQVAVEVLDEPADDGGRVRDRVVEAVAEGGCVLVVHNTVSRAQQTYLALRVLFGDDIELLHGRLTATERAARTERILARLGPDGERPPRYVVVATQLAEQSFDVDVDLLITDLAPMDLLLQRVGRLHRHERPAGSRPTALRMPRVVITGVRRTEGGPPELPGGSRAVYGAYPLFRAAALVDAAAAANGWSVPRDVPDLVARAYDECDRHVPPAWASAVATAYDDHLARVTERISNAQGYLLTPTDLLGKPTIEGLHELATANLNDDDAVAAVVRDGDPSVEVILIRHDPVRDVFLTLDGRSLGPGGEAVSDPDVLERVIGDAVRLPATKSITKAALAQLQPLPGWTADPWLKRARALPLDAAGAAELGGYRLAYEHDLGLVSRLATRPPRPTPAAAGTTSASHRQVRASLDDPRVAGT